MPIITKEMRSESYLEWECVPMYNVHVKSCIVEEGKKVIVDFYGKDEKAMVLVLKWKCILSLLLILFAHCLIN